MSRTCPPQEHLQRYLDGQLTEADEEAVAGHIEGCASCQTRLDGLSAPAGIPGSTLIANEERSVHSFLARIMALPAPSKAHARPVGPTRPPQMPPHYELLGEIGRGGMGVVYRARHRMLGREVAFKMILAGLYPTENDRQRFRSEAEATARLQHPNIVQLYETGEVDGQPYLVLEYVGGGNLQEKTAGRPQQPHAAARLVEVLARAVEHAHQEQIVHRDLKPANILLSVRPSEGAGEGGNPAEGTPDVARSRASLLPTEVKITDFGLAKKLDTQDVSHSGAVSGTPGYMAPEQVPAEIAAGHRPAVGRATDIYALGAILYQLLTGRPPFTGIDWMTTLLQAVHNDPLLPRTLQPGVPRDLETITLKCLQKDPAKRYHSARALADDLRRFLDGRPILARPVGPVERFAKWFRRRPLLGGALTTAVLAAVSAVAGLLIALSAVKARQEAERRTAEGLRERERLANVARSREERFRAQAELNLYLSRIAQANLLWRDLDVPAARRALADCPKGLRRWEWDLLERRCDDGLQVSSVPTGYQVQGLASGRGKAAGWLAVASVAAAAPGMRPAPAIVSLWGPQGGKPWRLGLPAGEVPRQLAFRGSAELIVLSQSSSRRGFARGWTLAQAAKGTTAWQVEFLGEPALSDDGRWLAAADSHGPQLFDLDGSRQPQALPLRGAVEGFAFSPGGDHPGHQTGDYLACAQNKEVVIVGLAAGEVMARWPARATALGFDQTGEKLAVCEPDRKILSLRQLDGRELATFAVAVAPGRQEVLFSPDGRYLVLHGQGDVQVADVRTRWQKTLVGHVGPVRAVAAGPDGRTLATAGADATVRLWDLGTASTWTQQRGLYRGHGGAVQALTFAADGRALYSGGSDGTVRAWDLTRGQGGLYLAPTRTAADEGAALVFEAQGQTLVRAYPDRFERWDAQVGLLRDGSSYQPRPAGTRPLPVVAAGKLVSVGARPEEICIRSLQTPASGLVLKGHDYPVTALAVSADGQVVLSGSAGLAGMNPPQPVGELCHWDAETGKLMERVSGPDLCVVALALNPDGIRVAVSTGWPGWSRSGQVPPAAALRLWKLGTDKLGQSLTSDPRGANICSHVAFHPGGEQLAAISPRRGRLSVWNLRSPEKAWEVKESGRMTDLAYHPDGSRLAVGLQGGVVVRDATNGNEAIRLPGLLEPPEGRTVATHVAFSPDGRQLAASDWTGSVLVHQAGTIDRADERAGARQRAFAWHLQAVEEGGPDPYPLAYHAAWLDRLKPPGPWYLLKRGRIRARQGRWQAARDDLLAAATVKEPADELTLQGIDWLLNNGKERKKKATSGDERADLLIRLLPPGGRVEGEDIRKARALLGQRRPMAELGLALALLRNREYSNVAGVLPPAGKRSGPEWLAACLAAQGQGNKEAAQHALAQARRWAQARQAEAVPGVGVAPAQTSAQEWVVFCALQKQAAAEQAGSTRQGSTPKEP